MSTGLALRTRFELAVLEDDDSVVWSSDGVPADFIEAEGSPDELAPEDAHFTLDSGEPAPPMTASRLAQLLELYGGVAPKTRPEHSPPADDVDEFYPI